MIKKRAVKHFNWRKYCWNHKLPSWYTKNDAIKHYLINSQTKKTQTIDDSSNTKFEKFSLSFNHNKNIAIFCHTIPTPDKDSGSNRLYEIIKILLKLEYNIYYFTHTELSDQPIYKQQLLDIGVKNVLCIDKTRNIYCDTLFKNLIEKEKINFDIAIFYFYDMYDIYIDSIKKILPNIKTIVDSVDVHWLRLERGNMCSNTAKNAEKIAYNTADVVFAVTENDKQHIQKECPNANVKILSNIHEFENHNPRYINKNLIFVGGSNHTPNIDACLYAIDIFQNFIKNNTEYGDSKLFLVGSYFDKQIIDKINNDNRIVILGHLTESELHKIYSSDIIGCLAPITWGAGIKGKICQAISHRIPVITTDIGNEGINLKNNFSGFIGNDIETLSNHIKQLFSLRSTDIKKLAINAQNQLKLLIGKESAIDVICGTLTCKHVVLSIATYNNALLTERCVNSIMANTIYPNFKIHITSNGCNDNTKNVLLNLQKIYGENKIGITFNKENKHFIYAHNDVIKKYKNSDILLINNDMEFIDSYWLNHLYSSAYSAGYIGCAGGKLLDYNFVVSESGAYIFNDGTGINFGRGLSRYDEMVNTKRYVGYVSGCLMYMKRNIIDKFGVLDTRFYPCYYEDSDWQYNIHMHGYKTIVDPRCEVLHKEGSSSNLISDFKNKCMKSNQIKFLEKYNTISIESLNS